MARRACLVAGTAAAVLTASAGASMIDLTPGAGSSGTFNAAIFEFFSLQPAGTGVLGPFVRIQATGTEQGYNTSGSPLPFDEKPGSWTHNVHLSDIPTVNVSGVDYLEFVLDINEMSSESLLSLDSVQIYTSPTGSQTTTTVSSLGTLRYDMGVGNYVLMDYNNAAGSGVTDMRMLVPLSNFDGAGADDYLYLYSMFGVNASAASGDGFEEWGFAQEVIPAPASLLVLASGLFFGGRRRRPR